MCLCMQWNLINNRILISCFFFSVMQPAVISYSKITFYPLFELTKHKTQGKDNFFAYMYVIKS